MLKIYNPYDLKDFISQYNPTEGEIEILLAEKFKSGGEEVRSTDDIFCIEHLIGKIQLDLSDIKGRDLRGLSINCSGQTEGGTINLGSFWNTTINNTFSSGNLVVYHESDVGGNVQNNERSSGENVQINLCKKGINIQNNLFSYGKNMQKNRGLCRSIQYNCHSIGSNIQLNDSLQSCFQNNYYSNGNNYQMNLFSSIDHIQDNRKSQGRNAQYVNNSIGANRQINSFFNFLLRKNVVITPA